MMFLNNISKRRLLGLVLLTCTLLSARWISFTPGGAERAPEIAVISANEFSLNLNINTFGARIDKIDTEHMLNTENENFVLLSIPDGYHTGEIGKPNLPTIKKTIGVPHGATINVEVVNMAYRDIPLSTFGVEERIIPALAPVLKLPGEKDIA
jgi:hypothetical protein